MITSEPKAWNYAQSGYVKFDGSDQNYYAFAQYTDQDEQCNYPQKICTNVTSTSECCGDNNQYSEFDDDYTASEFMYMTKGNGCSSNCDVGILQTYYNPAAVGAGDNHWPGPWTEQYEGETTNTGDDMPGQAGYRTSFTTVAYQTDDWGGSSGGHPSLQT